MSLASSIHALWHRWLLPTKEHQAEGEFEAMTDRLRCAADKIRKRAAQLDEAVERIEKQHGIDHQDPFDESR